MGLLRTKRTFRPAAMLLTIALLLTLSGNAGGAQVLLPGLQTDVDQVYDDVDDNACWIATASNCLHYGGWNTPGHDTPRAIYNDILHAIYAGQAGYPELAFQDYLHRHYGLDPSAYFHEEDDFAAVVPMIVHWINHGFGITIRVTDERGGSAHWITVWGYETNDSWRAGTDPEHERYSYLYLTDSTDASEETTGGLRQIPVMYLEDPSPHWWLDDYSAFPVIYDLVITRVQALAPRPASNHARFTTRSATGRWSMEEGSGDTIRDFSTNHHDGTRRGPAWVDGTRGQATYYGLSFNGQNDYVDMGDCLIDGWSEVTIEAWVRPDSLGTAKNPSGHSGNEHPILHKGGGKDAVDDNIGLTLSKGKKGARGTAFYIKTDQGEKTLRGTTLPSGKWTHLVATYDGSHMRLYINGELDASTTHRGTIISNSNALRIGGNHSRAYKAFYFHGLIDEVTLYDRALTQPQVQLLYGVQN